MKFVCSECGDCCRDFGHGPGLNLFYWEAKMFEEYYPFPVLYDKKNKQTIALFWNSRINNCPLLNKNKCIKYEDRPLVCKAFPLLNSGLISGKDFSFSLGCSQEKLLEKIAKKINSEKDENKRIEIMKEAFDDTFLALLQLELTRNFIYRELEKMEDKGLIKIDDSLNKISENIVDVFDLMLKTGHISKDKLKEIIDNIQNLKDARNYLNKKT
ncbi:MAG: YkgJ family cysteine cluster protein [Candidatus Woesearchaeota archaeon]|nr:MAG: YkgJ family cysteine cluster protein [Candidatus Woesearchaeota archaeon]